ncbi:Hypothetical predicted protein [Paramuricea clavata]|uniref:Lysophospholipid acyltransferase 7 n=2 Tax=Paramuricea clavata TaxID=317549 RepID=A0A7D9L3S1_PARCT|nr:Hypothetical predicted protein [Paramuricea clavata]
MSKEYSDVMQLRDIIFFVALLGSIPFGHFVKQIKSPSRKRFICTVAGVFLVLFLNGFQDFWHSFLTILGTYCICKSSRSVRWCNWISFLCVFGYLFFFRACTYVGLPHPSAYTDNVQLFITLRMVGLAFEIHETSVAKKSNTADESEKTEMNDEELQDMSFYHFLSYGYCYCGIFTGPYYKYKTYTDMLKQSNPDKIPSLDLALKWLTYLPLFVAGYAIFSQWFPAYLGKDQFHNQSVLVQIFLLALADIRFRCRIYIATHMSESSAMTLCLGAYPVESRPKPGQGPTKAIEDSSQKQKEEENTDLVTTDNKYSFETIRGMYVRKVELSSLKDMIRSWNTTVQWWMAAYVYQQFPLRNKLVR